MVGNEVSRPIHVLFNGDNFSQWSQAISSYLKGRKLWCYVSGVRTIPVKEEKESDAAYDLRLEEWESSNHQIITWFRCDASKPGGPLTTRQPAEYKWRSGYPTPL